jgi:hypothetical protein
MSLARLLSTPSHSLIGAHAAATAAADSPCRRALRPNSGYAQALGELARTPPPLPGRESHRSRRNPDEPAASRGQWPNCKARKLSREFCANEGPIHESLFLLRGFSVSWIFNSVADLQKLVKGVENRRKFRKFQNHFLDSWWKILQLLLYSHGLILGILSMKNRNVKNLDLP